ncbi:MAG: COX15/CtaA family protein [Gammaproteobacteria bacterium]
MKHNTPENISTRSIAAWLLLCCIMIYAMVVLGGVTRLTGSGLSMVEWDPVFGIVPPLSEQAWQTVFSKYQASPEYQKINLGMDLLGFKSIYWFEYAHRVLGRMIGTVFLLPFLYFLFRKMLPPRLTPRLALAFVLGGLQGLLGWYMVKSGLVDNPHVSQYRLTAHLGLALVIYAWLFWLFLDLVDRQHVIKDSTPFLRRISLAILALVAITITSGGFVAGLKAGHAYNTFPKMGDQWLPPAGWMLQPGWRNLFENIATVQFNHRLLAITTLACIVLFGAFNHKRVSALATRLGIYFLVVIACIQASLGISTLLLHVPVALAATHQAIAVLLLSSALFVAHRFRA